MATLPAAVQDLGHALAGQETAGGSCWGRCRAGGRSSGASESNVTTGIFFADGILHDLVERPGVGRAEDDTVHVLGDVAFQHGDLAGHVLLARVFEDGGGLGHRRRVLHAPGHLIPIRVDDLAQTAKGEALGLGRGRGRGLDRIVPRLVGRQIVLA